MVDVATDPTPWPGMGGSNPKVEVTMNLTMNMALQAYVSSNADCMAWAVNDAAWKVSTGGDIDINNLAITQHSNSRAHCASAQMLPTENNEMMVSAFNELAKTTITTANKQIDPSVSKETITSMGNITKVFNQTSLQECIAGALNKVTVEDVGSNHNVLITGSVIQNASAQIQNCLNVQTIPGITGATTKDAARDFAKSVQAMITPDTATGRLINCSVQHYWISTAVTYILLAVVVLLIRLVIFHFTTL